MSQKYVSEQPSGYKNHFSKVALVGASGQVGSFMVEELLKTGKINITAIIRTGSSSKAPDGVKTANIDYDDLSTIVAALQGHDVLIITMGTSAPYENVKKLVTAAAEANVSWILPDEWGLDPSQVELCEDVLLGPPRIEVRNLIESLGKSSWTALIPSFWYEFSLAGGPGDRYGFDIANRKVTMYDEGTVAINTSTWGHVGRAVAKLLTLPVLPKDANDKSTTLSTFRNKFCYVSSFTLSQRDMFASIQRVTGTKESDWTITHENSTERYNAAIKEFNNGNYGAYSTLLYTRVFYPGDEGNFGKRLGTHDETLGLSKDDLDESTKRAIRWKQAGKI